MCVARYAKLELIILVLEAKTLLLVPMGPDRLRKYHYALRYFWTLILGTRITLLYACIIFALTSTAGLLKRKLRA